MNGERIVRHTLSEIREINRRETGIDWERASSITEEEIEHLAREDNEALGLNHYWYETGRSVVGVDAVGTTEASIADAISQAKSFCITLPARVSDLLGGAERSFLADVETTSVAGA